MNGEVWEALTWSAVAMRNVVWPVVGPLVGGGRLVPVESVTSSGFARELDVMAGIDAWQIIDSREIVRGLASRVQGPTKRHPQGKNWESFTIRSRLPSGRPTEFQKRAAEMDAKDGRLGPYLVCQAYVNAKNNPVLLGAAVARMWDVIAAIRLGQSEERPAPGGNWFEFVRWEDLQANGAKIIVWPDQPALFHSRGA